MRKTILTAALFLLLLFLFPKNSFAQVPSCSSQGGTCKTSCGANERAVSATGCTAPRGPSVQCCVSTSPTSAPTGSTSQADEVTCNGGKGINTAIGCVPINDTNAFIGFILRWAIGIGGGIAFLLILYAGFMIMSSSGNPERLKAGQELMTSAIAGLIMLIFSVFILRVIGVDILKLPGFGG